MGLHNNGARKDMADLKLRQAIAIEAARLMYERTESEYFTAKRKAAKRLCRGSVKPSDLPSNREIRDQIQAVARMQEGDQRKRHLQEMRLAALHMMRARGYEHADIAWATAFPFYVKTVGARINRVFWWYRKKLV